MKKKKDLNYIPSFLSGWFNEKYNPIINIVELVVAEVIKKDLENINLENKKMLKKYSIKVKFRPTFALIKK